ncbi:MAG: hypothetical protein Q4G10_02620 [Bacteroidia bacterium]|nr:hypothetical protein [Bacteroidia bacterium]
MANKRKLLYALLVLFALLLIFWIVALFFPDEGEYGKLASWLGVIANAMGILSILVGLREMKKNNQ